MKIYLDNNVVSSIVRDDNQSQSEALNRLLEAYNEGKVDLVTSEITLEEIRKCQGPHRLYLERTFRLLRKVPIVSEHNLLYITNYFGPNISGSAPVFQRDSLLDSLVTLGLDETDARHIFTAVKQDCVIFLTCDDSRRTGILSRSKQITNLCGVKVQKPSEFVTDQGW